MSEQEERAEANFAAALKSSGARDPRDFYRDRLRALRGHDEAAYRTAVDYYRSELIPAVAAEDSDPLALWLEYGRRLATLTQPGETVQIDTSGRRQPYTPPVPADHMVLHLPRSTREAAITVGLPPQLSSAQKATYDLLVKRTV